MKTGKIFRRMLLTFVLVTWPAAFVSAQQPPDSPAHHDMGNTSMDTMKQCREQHGAMKKSVEELRNMLADAKKSNDNSKMRDAIDQAQKQLADMKQNMEACGKMAEMMEKMHGGMMK